MSHKNIIKIRYEETADVFDRRYHEIQNSKYEIIFQNISISSKQRILDAGCGTGFFFQFIDDFECKKYGLDFSIESLKICRRRIGKESSIAILCADADFLPFREEYFDIILAITVLQNLPTPKKSLEEFKRVCKLNGLIILSLLKKKFPPKRINNLLNDAQLSPKQIIDDEKCEDVIVVIENK
ncbi:MAG: class I SAM-dependent methyltransferase [Candidatus Helarchaeota archaeon]|nr:class I SAM-dependent methyltransferase [Candidatus Helarchaeota archaeon]